MNTYISHYTGENSKSIIKDTLITLGMKPKVVIVDTVLDMECLELKNELDRRYDEIVNTAKIENFHVSIIGRLNNQFCIDSYFYNPLITSKNRREHTVIDGLYNFKFVCMEHTGDKHFTDFRTIAKETNANNILLVKNAFKSTLERGVKHDDTINCNAMFESVRMVDIN